MEKTRKQHTQEFDETIKEYNDWLASLGNTKIQRKNRWLAFFKGISSIFHYQTRSSFRLNHPLYKRKDLTPEQIDVIALASDWKRVGNNLEEILKRDNSKEITSEGIRIGEKFVTNMYNHLRDAYVAYALS